MPELIADIIAETEPGRVEIRPVIKLPFTPEPVV
jgi:hypothetical protein